MPRGALRSRLSTEVLGDSMRRPRGPLGVAPWMAVTASPPPAPTEARWSRPNASRIPETALFNADEPKPRVDSTMVSTIPRRPDRAS
ncbi:hypothetical protein amb0755 [Paramagnetospirillum magneticum AMB-1]|uniref:Uncharacterized protein n=1 Tax=Paramagnetospirillum magneticum (strain ATCC 700264 / AMB-1) TaxID=342108 RepID=Q2W9B6_PARM1|nr:hypothetical protein amb0755 [Paramagnetospirillum magneticum AMB-1]